MKKIASIVLACMLVALVIMLGTQVKGSEAEGKYVWNVAMNVSESTLNYKFYEEFKRIIEEQSNGEVVVNLYPNGQLGGDAEQLLGLIGGSYDFSTTVTSSMTSTIPEYGVFDLPNAFANVDVMRAVETDEALLAALNEASAAKGIYLLGMSDAGFRELTTNTEVHDISDMSGMKIRVMDNPYHQGYWNSLGCASTTMDFNEVYSSLQQRVIDAEENPYMNICSNNFYEVQDYIVETNHLGHIMIFTMNYDLYESLSDDMKDLVNNCAAQALEITNAAADEAIEQYKATITESGSSIIELEPEVLAQMQEMASPVYDMVRKDIGDELVDIFMAACENAQ